MKNLFKLSTIVLFAGAMYLNLQQIDSKPLSENGIAMLELETMSAMASECVYWENGELVVECSTWGWGCCMICKAVAYQGGGGDTYCDPNGNVQDYCPFLCML